MTQTTSPDRTLPQQLIDLAVLAIHRGAERVSLRHEGLGADFPAPIGWLLTFHMEDDPARPEKKRSAFFVHQVGCDLDDIVAPDWLRDEPEAPTVDELVQLFQTGARNEWEVTYVRDYLERSVMNSLAEEYPESTALAKFGMRHRLEAQAHNWGYDDAAAARGDRISTTLLLSVRESGNPDVIAFADDGGTHRQVDQAHVAGLLRQTAPNATPVAYYAGDEDGWVL